MRRPSHHSTPAPWVSASTSTANKEVGATTIGRANSACALIGTISRASTLGQTIGPPALKLYAVEPVGRCADHSVAAPARERSTIDLDYYLDHALASRLFDACFVERERAGNQFGALEHCDINRQPILRLVSSMDHGVDRGLDILWFGLGQEADVAQVYPQQWRTAQVGDLSGTKDRAVSTDHDREFAIVASVIFALGDLDLDRSRRRRGSPTPRLRCAAAEQSVRDESARHRTDGQLRGPPRGQGAPAGARESGGSGRNASSSIGRNSVTAQPSHSPPPVRGSAPPHPQFRRRRSGLVVAKPRKNSTLPEGTGKGASDHAVCPPPQIGRGRRHRLNRLGPQGQVANHPALADSFLAHLELRFDHQHEAAAGSTRPSTRQDEPKEMKDRSPTTRSTGPPMTSGVRVANIGPVVDDYAGILAEGPGQLSVADVDRYDFGRTLPQKDVREATCRAPRHRGSETRPPEPKRTKVDSAPTNLWAPPETYPDRCRRRNDDRHIGSRPRSAAFGAIAPPTLTRLARINSVAWSRERASPRLTSSASRRKRRGDTRSAARRPAQRRTKGGMNSS